MFCLFLSLFYCPIVLLFYCFIGLLFYCLIVLLFYCFSLFVPHTMLFIWISSTSDVVAQFRELTGPLSPELARVLRPKSLRALFGRDIALNGIHCTDLLDDGEMECAYVFHTLASLSLWFFLECLFISMIIYFIFTYSRVLKSLELIILFLFRWIILYFEL